MGDEIPASTFNRVAQSAHVGWGMAVVLAAGAGWGLRGAAIAWAVWTLYCAVKEFGYDERYETAAVRGSSLEDFLFAMLGATAGLGIVWLGGKGQ